MRNKFLPYTSEIRTQCRLSPLKSTRVFIYLRLNCDLLFADIDNCINHTCSNGGSCIDGFDSYSCNCLVGFIGDHCETGRMHVVAVVEDLIACAHNFANLINMVSMFDLVKEKLRREFESSRYQNDIYRVNKLLR